MARTASRAPPRRLIGYARVSTEEQATDAQVDELKAAGCQIVHQEHGSGASRARPVLARLMREIDAGDVLVVVRLDRLARSVSHLLVVIEDLEARGAHFRSLRDPIDTSTPRGRLPGNPGLRDRRPEAIRAALEARQKVYVGDLIASASTWKSAHCAPMAFICSKCDTGPPR